MTTSSLVLLWCLFTCIICDERRLANQEDDPGYESYQHVEKMVTNQPIIYLLYRNFWPDGVKCIYIKFGSKGTSVVYPSTELGYMSSSYMETQEVTMNTETTRYPNREDFRKTRSGPNALVYTKIQENGEIDASAKSYPLIYSDYSSCTVIRVPDENGRYGCEMYVSDQNNQPSEVCNSVYKSSCGMEKYTVWDNSCSTAMDDDIVWSK